MSQHAHDFTQAEAFGLRARPTVVAGGTEPAVWEAHRSGRRLVSLRSVRQGADIVVECTVDPQSAAAGMPSKRVSYVFPDEQEAKRFLDETALALRYLGCEIVQ